MIKDIFTRHQMEIADFSMIDYGRIQKSNFTQLPLVENVIKYKVTNWLPSSQQVTDSDQSWIRSLGELLVIIDATDELAQYLIEDRETGARLNRTTLLKAGNIRVQKCLNGIAVSPETNAYVAWEDTTLYIDGNPSSLYHKLINEISRYFRTDIAKALIRDCVCRDPEWIKDYAHSHLRVDGSLEKHDTEESDGPSIENDIPPEQNDIQPSDEGNRNGHPIITRIAPPRRDIRMERLTVFLKSKGYV